ncbi:MAG TPA: response regulator [bacterium]|nr:response regulator [bacterium]
MTMTRPLDILLVEDEAITVMALRIELRQAGFNVLRSVATGEDAVGSLEDAVPDVILMDMRLAGRLTGMDTAVLIREKHPIPIVFMTGYPDAALLEKAKRMDSVGYVVKPVSASSIKAAVEGVLGSGPDSKSTG